MKKYTCEDCKKQYKSQGSLYNIYKDETGALHKLCKDCSKKELIKHGFDIKLIESKEE